MSKNEIDYGKLEEKIYKKAYKLSDVKDRIEKVAFDIVRFKDDDNAANLWQVQSADDGDYIIALYEQTESKEKISESSWSVKLSKLSNKMNFYYKGDPIVSMASSNLGIPVGEVEKAAGYLPKKLATNQKLVSALLKELSQDSRNSVLTKYPELKKA